MSMSTPSSRFLCCLAAGGTLLLGACLLTACQGGNLPLTTGAEDASEDAEARAAHYEDAAKTYLEGERWDDAITMYRKVLKDRPGDKVAQWGLAKALYGKGGLANLKESAKILDDIKGHNWAHPEFGDRRWAVLRDLGHAEAEIAEVYDKDARRGKRMLETNPNADVQLTESRIYQQEQKRDQHLDRAIPAYRQVLSLKEDDTRSIAGLARAHLARGNDDMGLRWAGRYLELTKGSQDFWRDRMIEFEEQRGGQVTDKQRNLFLDKLKGAKEKEKAMHMMVGAVYMRRGNFAQAQGAFSTVIKMDPRMPAPYVERAQAFAALRQYRPAVGDLEHYLKITDPQEHRRERINAAQLLDRYQRVLGGPGFLRSQEQPTREGFGG